MSTATAPGSLPRYIVQRLLLIIPMVWFILTLVFLLMRVAPGDPVSASVGGRLPEAALDQRREALGLNDPLIQQYWDYLSGVLTLDFGNTITDNTPITQIVKENGGATLTLTISAMLLALVVGLPLGLIAGRYRDTPADGGIRIFGIVTYAAPVFYTGLLVQLLFLNVFSGWPLLGQSTPITEFTVETRTHILLLDAIIAGDGDAVIDVLKHLMLPAVTLGLLICGIFIRLTRVNVLQTLQADYVEAARARGIPERRVVRSHAFRNAMVPVVTIIGLQVALLLSGAVLTEKTFAWPGLGNQLITYIDQRDYAAVQGIITLFAVVVVLISILIDIVIALIDPRVRY
ncbi:ABC transporter permease [Nocardioides sp. YIM 152315]|uniref:ABC transporter permease n=1 Tax=Nocardioides sp. YIM 152315 TaxID=3031760 RepID=UPI0023DC64BE|nr:ABC transporter permease [Nocardioides sp. YIM 152315]MDF1602607.1 ABC transporter permease [Nocardioides sp. YIM 152315]